MYGVVLEGLYYYLRTVFGEEMLQQIREKGNINHTNFNTHKVYSETAIPRIVKAAQEVTGMSEDLLMESFGVTFVSYVARYGYDKILKVLGRTMRDFLSNLDNLHEYLRFSYPKIPPTSFMVTEETAEGLTLLYRSHRKGLTTFVMGQLRQIGKEFYNTKVKVELLQADTFHTSHGYNYVKMKLYFDNTEAFQTYQPEIFTDDANLPITSDQFFGLFPFYMVISRELQIVAVGEALSSVIPDLVGAQADDLFYMQKPMIDFHWETILMHTNNVFEIESVDAIEHGSEEDDFEDESASSIGDLTSSIGDLASSIGDRTSIISDDQVPTNKRTLTLKGQMIYMPEWDALLFLGTPVIEDLNHMFRLGLNINDLSIHDSSREFVLAGSQQSAELKLLLDQEQMKSKMLEENLKRLDSEMRRSDQLLFEMIPRTVADRLRSGEPTINTCEIFDICTILFSDVVGFTSICSAISPMQVVSMLNAMYTTFDTLIEKHQVHKVETIGDAYMIVGGVPAKTSKHALLITEMAFSMLRALKTLKDPSDRTGKGHLRLRIGIHSGTVVAGVVGLKMPRYCLFGDAVNIASRMESTGQPMMVHSSEATRDCMVDHPQYKFEEREICILFPGKRQLQTYWIHDAEQN